MNPGSFPSPSPGSAPLTHSPLSQYVNQASHNNHNHHHSPPIARTGSGSYPMSHPTSTSTGNGNGHGHGHPRQQAGHPNPSSVDDHHREGSTNSGSGSGSGSYEARAGSGVGGGAGEKRLSSELSNMDVQSMIDSLRQQQVYDYLRVCTNPELRKFLDSASKKGQRGASLESVQFSDCVVKINRKQKRQERALVITDKAIYNFAPKSYNKCKRRITLDALKAVILSLSSQEIVFQVDNSYDYRFDIARRSDVLEMINKNYEKLHGKPLTVHMSAERELKNFCRTKSGSQPQIPLPMPTYPGSLSSSPSSSPPATHSSMQAPKRSSLEKNSIISTAAGTSTNTIQHINNNTTTSTHQTGQNNNSAPTTGFRESRLEGWLTKKKGKSDKWDRKYFILSDSKLQYYSPRIKGNMQIAGRVTVERVMEDVKKQTIDIFNIANASIRGRTPDGQSASFRVKNQFLNFRIKVVSENRKQPLHIAAESESEMHRWMQAFSGVVGKQGEENKPVHLEGWLMKKDPTSKNWRRRYFVLIKDRCWYFEMGLKGTIDMTSGVSAHAANVLPTEDPARKNFAYESAASRYAYRWNVSDSARIFYLAADSFENMQLWISAIEKASRRHFPGLQYEEQKSLPDDFVEAIEQEAPDKLVTFVFTDVQNSTNLWEAVPDAMDQSLEQHDRILRELLKKYRGYEVKTEGDAFMVTFFTPIDAVLWCMEVQQRLLEAEWSDEFLTMPSAKKEFKMDPETGASVMVFNGIRIRMGIHCGEPNCRRNPVTGRMDYFGPVVNRSARVSDVAHGGQVVGTQELVDFLEREKDTHPLLQGCCYPLVSDLGCHNLKGIHEPVRIFQLMPQSLSLRTLPPIRTVNNEEKEKHEKQGQTQTQTQAINVMSPVNNNGNRFGAAALAAMSPSASASASPSPYRSSVSLSSPPPPPPPGVSAYHAPPSSYSTIYPQSSPQLSYPYSNVRPNPNEVNDTDNTTSTSSPSASASAAASVSSQNRRTSPSNQPGLAWALPGMSNNTPPPPPQPR